MKKNKILPFIIIGLGLSYAAYLIYRKKQALDQIEIIKFRNNNNIPNSGDDWKRWIYLVILIHGFAKSLWEPGGIFYNTNVPKPDPNGKLDMIISEAKKLF